MRVMEALTLSRLRPIGCAVLFAALLSHAAPPSFAERVQLIPHFRAGQILFYRIDFSSALNAKTQSRVTSPQLPPTSNANASGLLQVEIAEATSSSLRLKTFYSERDSSAAPSQSQETPQTQNRAASPDRVVEVSIAADGSASRISGLDQLSSAQQFAWRDWLSTFASSMTYPKSGINTGQKWQTFEPETSPSPIAELSWAKQYQYVRDEPCRFADAEPKSGSGKPPSPPQPCAVIFVISTLRQKSSRKNATPEDYKLRNLKTRGTVAGHNETILYVSRSTGLLVRSIEDAQQTMDALIALEDGSNEVRYSVDAKSHSDISLLSGSPQSIR
jgi:hypothetical protein